MLKFNSSRLPWSPIYRVQTLYKPCQFRLPRRAPAIGVDPANAYPFEPPQGHRIRRNLDALQVVP